MRLFLLCLFIILDSGVALAQSSSLTRIQERVNLSLPEHPNHYIVAIDASGSTVETFAKERAYRTALHSVMLTSLYRKGFGWRIPPFHSGQDVLSVFHFGAVRGATKAAYQVLPQYDFLHNYMHPVGGCVRRSRITEAQLRSLLVPQSHFQYGMVSWAMPMAVWASRPGKGRSVAQRTFMITVTDALPNATTIAREANEIERQIRHSEKFRAAHRISDSVDKNYMFTNRNGHLRWAWQRKIYPSDGSSPIFVEAYEVVSVRRHEWENAPARWSPFKNVEAVWANESLQNPKLDIHAELRTEFLRWLKKGGRFHGVVQVDATGAGQPHKAAWDYKAQWQLPLQVASGVNRAPQRGRVMLRLSIDQSDSCLGVRKATYSWIEEFDVPIHPTLTQDYRRRRALHALGILVLLCVLSGVGWWWIYHRYYAPHFVIELPGALSPMRLWQAERSSYVVSMQPRPRGRAFTVRLPSRMIQRLFYRHASILIETKQDCSLRWLDSGACVDALGLPRASNRAVAIWEEMGEAPPALKLVFNHGRRWSTIDINYRRPKPDFEETNMLSTHGRKFTHLVSLDLGSETMAAYCRDIVANKDYMIDLQHRASEMGSNAHDDNEDKIDYYIEVVETDNPPSTKRLKRRSRRLRNRIGLQDRKQPARMGDAHAELDLPNNDHCLFRYFFQKGQEALTHRIMPNPKILFQLGVDSPLPVVESVDPQYPVQLEPEQLLQHLVTQIVRNFVLKSRELATVDPQNVHLIVTVPNVYSLTHQKSIEDYLRDHTQVGEVTVLYESDAVAYYILNTKKNKQLDSKSQQVKESLFRHIDNPDHTYTRLVTIDVGRGTTDLSLIQIAKPEAPGKPQTHTVFARTGKSDGGNRLSYLIAQFYNEQLEAAFAKHDILIGSDKPPFGLLRLPQGEKERSVNQSRALMVIEHLIDAVKSNVTDRFVLNLSLDEQKRQLEELLELMFKFIDVNWAASDKKDNYLQFQQHAVELMLLPREWRNPLRFRRKGVEKNLGAVLKLRGNIERYIEENITVLIQELGRMAVNRHRQLNGLPTEEITQGDINEAFEDAFVVVAGQASQFKPLRCAIEHAFSPRLKDRIIFLNGSLAKEACCQGAVSFLQSRNEFENELELHGTYGFLSVVMGGTAFLPVSTQKVNEISQGQSMVSVPFHVLTDRWFVYTPRVITDRDLENYSRCPQVGDGMTATLSCVSADQLTTGKTSYDVCYNPSNATLRVNGADVKLATFGDIDSHIWPKVWPEVLEPGEEDIIEGE